MCYLENSLIISIFSEPKHHLCVCVCVCVYVCELLTCVQLLATPWIVACQALLSVGFSRQEYWKGLPFPPSGYLPRPGIETRLLHWQVDSLPLCHLGSPKFNLQHVSYDQVPTLSGPQSEARMSFLMLAYFSSLFSLLSLTCNLS